MTLRVPRLPRYMARSAMSSSVPLSRACSGKLATPMQVVRLSERPSARQEAVRLQGAADALATFRAPPESVWRQHHHVLVPAVAGHHVVVAHASP